MRFQITNDHKVVDSSNSNNEGCERDYLGKVMINRNTVGLLNTKNILVYGSQRVEVEDNTFNVASDAGIFVENAKELLVRRNTFGFVLRSPAIELVRYIKSIIRKPS